MNQNNVSPDEIAKFDRMAKQWWDPKGPMKPLHQLNPLRMSYIEQHCALKDAQVLDVGCGAGILSEALAKAGAKTSAIDLSEQVLEAAKHHAQENDLSIDYQQQTVEQMANDMPDQFDIVTCMEMLEHVPDPESIIKACATLVKPGGFIFFSTINRTVKAFLGAIVAAEYIARLLPMGTHEYKKFIKPSELTLWATRAGLELKGIKGIDYHPISGDFELSSNSGINYLIHYQRPINV